MIEDLKPYPEYQESGACWLGQVPKHWSIMPNRAIFEEVNDRDHPREEMLSVTITRGIVRQRALLADTSKKDSSNQNKSAYKLVQPNDIAYNKMRAWQGAIGVSDLRGIISPAYVVMRLRSSQVPRYLHHLYRTPQFAKEAERWSYGITSDMWSLRPEHFKMIYTALPPRDEQTAIVRFLDYANAKIERAIRAKRKLIGLLNEQKQAIIHRAVTRGLDPNVKLKPSGIPWLGDVPQHWEVVALRFRYDQCLGKMLDAKKVTGRHLVPYLRNTDVQWDKINIKNLPSMDIKDHELARYTVQRGDLLVCEGGDVGRCAFWNGELNVCGFQKAVHRLRPLQPDRDCPRFQFYLMFLASKTGVFLADGSVSTIPHLTGDKLRAHRFVYPPFIEQEAISHFLDSELEVLSNVIWRTESEIAFLREYRTTLTAEVVTGKLDVREAAKRLPDEAVETLPPDDSMDELIEDEIDQEDDA